MEDSQLCPQKHEPVLLSTLCPEVDVSYSFAVGSVEFFLHSTRIYTCYLRPLGWAFLTWSFLYVFSTSHLVLQEGLAILSAAASWVIFFLSSF